MESCQTSAEASTGTGLPVEPTAGEHSAVRILGAAAFVLLAVALCARALLNEYRTVSVEQLLTEPADRSSGTLMARHLTHLLAAGGTALAATWVALSRRRWRLTALEIGAIVLTCGALLSVPVASDKRLALNTAMDTILPLIAAATLYQLLGHRSAWRRALLAGLVAVSAANCWKATAQWGWEYRKVRDTYLQIKAQFWSQRGISLDDPAVAAFESTFSESRPMGFIQCVNVFSSFLLLGLAWTGAGLAGCGCWRARGQGTGHDPGNGPVNDKSPCPPGTHAAVARPLHGSDRDDTPSPAAFQPAMIAAVVLLALTVWTLVVLLWDHVVGSMVGLLAALATGAAGLWLRDRPKRLAIVLATGLVLLQTTIVALATGPRDVQRVILDGKLAGRKSGSLVARFYLWDGGVRLFSAHPLTGVGPSQFAKRYLAIRPPYSSVKKPPDAHNWMLNVAAEWGILGVLGVLIAVGGCGWSIVRALARPPDEIHRAAHAALLPAMLVVLGCWLIAGSDLPRSLWAKILAYPLLISLPVAALVSFCKLYGRTGQVILLAGLVGFVVHCTDEITPSVSGVMWPFWATVALAMAWKGHVPVSSIAQNPVRRRIAQAWPVLAWAASLAVVALTVRPVQAVALMHRAQQAYLDHKPEQGVQLLRAAAAADPLDPLPLKTAALVRYRLGQTDTARALSHFRDFVALSGGAVQRDPFDYDCWRSLALANMYLATGIGDFALVDEAIRNMRKALELNPQWPEGWLELARMAAVTGGRQGDQSALLRTALEALDKALVLEDGRPSETPPALTAEARQEALRMREELLGRLAAAAAQSATTQPAP